MAICQRWAGPTVGGRDMESGDHIPVQHHGSLPLALKLQPEDQPQVEFDLPQFLVMAPLLLGGVWVCIRVGMTFHMLCYL